MNANAFHGSEGAPDESTWGRSRNSSCTAGDFSSEDLTADEARRPALHRARSGAVAH
jgi:hypothetical protein